jgi:hypothetical protein
MVPVELNDMYINIGANNGSKKNFQPIFSIMSEASKFLHHINLYFGSLGSPSSLVLLSLCTSNHTALFFEIPQSRYICSQDIPFWQYLWFFSIRSSASRQSIRNTWKLLKCGAGEGWKR